EHLVAAQIAHLSGENTVIRYFPYFRNREAGHRGLVGGSGKVIFEALCTVSSSHAHLVLSPKQSHVSDSLHRNFPAQVVPFHYEYIRPVRHGFTSMVSTPGLINPGGMEYLLPPAIE